MYKGKELVQLAETQLGTRGAQAKAYCGLPSNANYCDAFVSWLFYKEGVKRLFCNGTKQTYCPTTIQILYKENASIPIYLALPGDIILFDWEPNGNPNHIGIVRNRVSDLEIDTVEGNTSGYGTTGVVAEKTRTYFATVNGRKKVVIQAVFRPEFVPDSFDASKKLDIDGQFGFDSIARTQKALKKLGYYGGNVDAILGQQTVKALQEWAGVTQDGSWGIKTSKAIQRKLDVKVDGYFGVKSVKALQKWANEHAEKTLGDKIADTAKSYVGKVRYKLGGTSLKTGIDCTGFIQAIYGLNGIHLDNKLSDWGKSIGTDLSKAQPGDILSFKNPKTGKIAHHAIYIGDGKCVHASTTHKDWHKDVCISKVSSMSKPLAGIRRKWK